MILTDTKVPVSAENVNSNMAFSSPYVQIGLEIGQRSWEMTIRSPVPELFEKTHHLFNGKLSSVSRAALDKIEEIATFARQRGMETHVVYEAGGFGQKLGREVIQRGAIPVQLVARNIEYVRFGSRQQHVPKTDRLDSQRQAHIPLDHPDLPYADVQTLEEEAFRDLYKEQCRLEKLIHQLNAKMCAQLRRLHVDATHCAVSTWEKRLDEITKDCSVKTFCLNNLLDELKNATEKHRTTQAMFCDEITSIHADWQPPDPEMQPQEPGRHPLQPLGANSPLRDTSLPHALLEIRGIGAVTVITFLALVGNPRRFKNAKAFRAHMGLSSTPFISCTTKKSFGMKRGNPQLRKLMIQLAWRWCNMHPTHTLAEKYSATRNGSRRGKKIAICALAGELAEMLYSYLVHGKPLQLSSQTSTQ